MDNKVKNVLLLVLVIGLVGMTSAYALLSTSFQINSTAKVTGATWDVHFANLKQPSVSGNFNRARATDAATNPAEITGSTTIHNLYAEFNEPGGSVSYEFDVVNAGTLDAKLVNWTKSNPTCTGLDTTQNANANADFCSSYISYSLTRKSDSSTVSANDTLGKAVSGTPTTETWVLTITSTLDQAHWPANDVTISNMDITFDFQQN